MSRARFVSDREASWKRLARVLNDLESRGRKSSALHAELPSLYRAVAGDLSLARHRAYGLALEERLNALSLRAYHQLHGARLGLLRRFGRFVTVGIPRAVRAEGRLMLLCSVLFWAPFILLTLAGAWAPHWVQAALPAEMAAGLDQGFGGESIQRDSQSNLMMFGHYIRNNVGIDFRTYAGGLLAGVGALFFMIFNAIVLGAAFGYSWMQGYSETFLRFVVGHGAPELWAIVVSATGGLRLGLTLIAPGRRSRRAALAEDGRRSVHLAAGAGVMTTVAAFIEAFWSANDFSLTVKLAVGGPLWVLVPAWLLFAGRRR